MWPWAMQITEDMKDKSGFIMKKIKNVMYFYVNQSQFYSDLDKC